MQRIKNQTTFARLSWNPYLYNPKLARRLYRVKAPTLVIWGREDRVIPFENAELWLEAVPHARLVAIDECGHAPHRERPGPARPPRQRLPEGASVVEFHFFHLMPWPDLPDDFEQKHDSAWVTYSNANFDPGRGHELYNRYLDELEYADELGFDGVCVNEHHQTAYGLMPAPNIIAATLARRTKRITIAILGNAIPLRDHPLRVAEEVAMLDVITGGRIISGFVRGLGAEYFSLGIDPTHSRDRFLEACDLIMRAWTEPGPFSFEGKNYQVRYVNPWPKPIQKPHPRDLVPSTGSVETIEWASERRFPFIRVYEVASVVKQLFDEYRAAAEGWATVRARSSWGGWCRSTSRRRRS